MSVEPLPAYIVMAAGVAEGRAGAIEAWRGTLGPDDTLEERYAALCERSPYGAPVLRLVQHRASGRFIGVAALGPRRMVCGGREVRAAVLSHFAIDREHRSLGPALMLLESLLAEGRQRFDLVYGVPRNSAGAGAVLRRAGLKPVGQIVRLVCVVRHAPYLRRKMAGPLAACVGWLADRWRDLRALPVARASACLRAEWTSAADGRMDRLWETGVRGETLYSERGTRMLRWRLDGAVASTVRYLVLGDADGQPSAWFACEVNPAWPHILNVLDFWSDAGGVVSRAQVQGLVRQARKAGMAAVSVSLCASAASMAAWTASGFVERARQDVHGTWCDPSLAAAPPPLHFTDLEQDG